MVPSAFPFLRARSSSSISLKLAISQRTSDRKVRCGFEVLRFRRGIVRPRPSALEASGLIRRCRQAGRSHGRGVVAGWVDCDGGEFALGVRRDGADERWRTGHRTVGSRRRAFHHRSQEEPYQARWRRVRRSLSLDGPGFADDLACRYVALERLE